MEERALIPLPTDERGWLQEGTTFLDDRRPAPAAPLVTRWQHPDYHCCCRVSQRDVDEQHPDPGYLDRLCQRVEEGEGQPLLERPELSHKLRELWEGSPHLRQRLLLDRGIRDAVSGLTIGEQAARGGIPLPDSSLEPCSLHRAPQRVPGSAAVCCTWGTPPRDDVLRALCAESLPFRGRLPRLLVVHTGSSGVLGEAGAHLPTLLQRVIGPCLPSFRDGGGRAILIGPGFATADWLRDRLRSDPVGWGPVSVLPRLLTEPTALSLRRLAHDERRRVVFVHNLLGEDPRDDPAAMELQQRHTGAILGFGDGGDDGLALLGFRLPRSPGGTRYLVGTLHPQAFARVDNTESTLLVRSPPIHPFHPFAVYDHTSYHRALHYFNTITRTNIYEQQGGETPLGRPQQGGQKTLNPSDLLRQSECRCHDCTVSRLLPALFGAPGQRDGRGTATSRDSDMGVDTAGQ